MGLTKILKRRKNIRYLNLIILNIFMMAIFLMALELSIRMGFIEYFEYNKNVFQKSDNKIILYEYKSNCIYPADPEYLGDKHMWGVKITNNYGMRNIKDFPLKKDKNVLRIAVIGDSVTGPPDLEQMYPNQLEDLLNKRNDSKRYEVLNFGVNGYSTKQELEVLKVKALQFNPDMIIIGYVMNDLEMAKIPGDYFRYYNFRALGFLMSKIHIIKIKIIKEKDYYEKIYEPDSKTWKSVVDSFEEIKKISEERGIKVMFVLFPLIPQPGQKISKPLYPELHNQVIKEVQKNNFIIVDLFEAFNKAGFDNIRFHEMDTVHYNPRGYFIAAKEIVEKLKKEANLF